MVIGLIVFLNSISYGKDGRDGRDFHPYKTKAENDSSKEFPLIADTCL
jgi:hypothetical protein